MNFFALCLLSCMLTSRDKFLIQYKVPYIAVLLIRCVEQVDVPIPSFGW